MTVRLTSLQASGTLGKHVFKALVDAGFEVTVLTRSKKPGAYESAIEVLEVDFTSVESLASALTDIDAVVSTVSGKAIETQTLLIDAAVAAGVKRFIPSEFGSVSTNPKLESFPYYSAMANIRKYLQNNSTAGNLTWTVLACGAFLEFVLNMPPVLDFKNHTATILDSGDNRVSSTSMPVVGTAIAAILKHFEVTKNKVLHVSEVIWTQNQLLGFAKELKPTTKWEISKVQTDVLVKDSLEQIHAGDSSMPVMLKLIMGTALAGDTYGGAYDVTDNQLLGVNELTTDDLKTLVARTLA
jgi:hypothetical protein